MSGFNRNALGLDVRRVAIVDVYEDGRVRVRDTNSQQYVIRGDLRPKGAGFPAQDEIWLMKREAGSWRLVAQVGATVPVVSGPRSSADPVTLSLLHALASLGIVSDGTTA